EELLQRAVQHRAAPDDRRIVLREETHRDDLQAVFLGRHDLLSVGRELRLHPEHDRHVRAVDVAVDDADAAAAFRERDREVHGHRRLADAALAGADRDHVLHARQRDARSVGADGLAHARGGRDVDRLHAGQLHDGGTRLIAHLILHGTRRRRELDREGDAAAVDLQLLDEPEADDVAIEIGIANDLQRLENGALLNLHIPKNIVHSPAVPDVDRFPNRGMMIVLAYLWPLALVPLLLDKADPEAQWHAKHGLVL